MLSLEAFDGWVWNKSIGVVAAGHSLVLVLVILDKAAAVGSPLSLPGDVLHRLRQMPTENLGKVVAEASTNEGSKAHGKEGGVLVAVPVREIVNDNGGNDLPDAGEGGEQPDGDRSEGGRVDTECEE